MTIENKPDIESHVCENARTAYARIKELSSEFPNIKKSETYKCQSFVSTASQIKNEKIKKVSERHINRIIEILSLAGINLQRNDFAKSTESFLALLRNSNTKTSATSKKDGMLGLFCILYIGRFSRDESYQPKIRVGFLHGSPTDQGTIALQYMPYDLAGHRLWFNGIASTPENEIPSHPDIIELHFKSKGLIPPDYFQIFAENNREEYYTGVGIIYNILRSTPGACRTLLIKITEAEIQKGELKSDMCIPKDWPEEKRLMDLLVNTVQPIHEENSLADGLIPSPSRLYPPDLEKVHLAQREVLAPIQKKLIQLIKENKYLP